MNFLKRMLFNQPPPLRHEEWDKRVKEGDNEYQTLYYGNGGGIQLYSYRATMEFYYSSAGGLQSMSFDVDQALRDFLQPQYTDNLLPYHPAKVESKISNHNVTLHITGDKYQFMFSWLWFQPYPGGDAQGYMTMPRSEIERFLNDINKETTNDTN